MVQFFRSRQHDGRRRVVSDDADGAPTTAQTSSRQSAKSASRRYTADAARDKQPRLIDLVPHSLPKLLLLFFLGVGVIGGIEALYATRVLDVAGSRLPAFDLGVEGSLNNWFTSLSLDLATIVALIIYSLRRHRMDDYHGRYRVWLWAAACWLWLSVDEAASLHQSLQNTLSALAGQGAREAEFVMFGLYALLAGGVGLRLFFEMRSCRTAVVAMTLVAAVYGAAIVAHFGWLPPAAREYGLLIEEGCEMGGSWLLVLAMCLYARYVVLDSQGLLPARAEKDKEKEKESATTGGRGLFGRKTKVDAAHATVRPSSKRSDLESAPIKHSEDYEDDSAADDEDEDDATGAAHDVHKLSKAERKAMRRQQDKQRKTRLG